MTFAGGSAGTGMLGGEVGADMVEEIGADIILAEGEEEEGEAIWETEDTVGIEEGTAEGIEGTEDGMEEIVDTEATDTVDEVEDEVGMEATVEATTAETIAEILIVETTDLYVASCSFFSPELS